MRKGKPIDLAEAGRLLTEERLTRLEIAQRLGVCKQRLGRAMRKLPVSIGKKAVVGTYRLTEARAANVEAAEKRRADILALHKLGMPHIEIAKRLGCSRTSVWRAVGPASERAIPVPMWVPAFLKDTYRAVGREHGEEAAASRVRRLKQEAERACL